MSGNITCDLRSDCSKGQQKTQAVYQVYFCQVLLLLQPSVEGYIVSLKTQTPEENLTFWQTIAFAEAPVERVDEMTYFRSSAVMLQALLKISKLPKGFTDNSNLAHRLLETYTHIHFKSKFQEQLG